MKRKIFSGLFALMLVLSFSMIPGTPAAADGPTIELKPSEVSFYSMGTGMAEWSVEQAHPPVGTHSAKLSTLTEVDVAGVGVPWGCTIEDIDSMSFWHFCHDVKWTQWPRVAMELDGDHDGECKTKYKDCYLVSSIIKQTPETWQQWELVPETAFWWYVDPTTRQNYADGDPPYPTYPVSFTEAQAFWPDAKVLTVAVYLGEGLEKIVYIDDLEVNGEVWDMEPTDDDCARTGEAVQIFVDDPTAGTGPGHEGTAVEEQDESLPTDKFYLDHQPRGPKGEIVVTDMAGTTYTVDTIGQDGGDYITLTSSPPDSVGLMSPKAIAYDLELDSQPTIPTPLTVTTGIYNGGWTDAAPGVDDWTIVTIAGTAADDTHINEVFMFSGAVFQITGSQAFKSVYTNGVDAARSSGAVCTYIKISAPNKVWVTYDWHQQDTVTVTVTNNQVEPCEIVVECSEVDQLTLQPDKDSGFFKGTFYLTYPDCDDAKDWLEVEHCKTVTAEYDLISDFIGIDDEPPVFSNESPYPSTNESLPEISVDIDDDKCPVREESLRLFVSDTDDPPPFDPAEEVDSEDFDFTAGVLTYTPDDTLPDGTYYVRVKAADCCYNWAEIDWSFEVESSPPRMIDAITGWTWHWGHYCDRPMNSHTTTSIMVMFSERLDPTSVQASDFRVNYIIPADAEYHDFNPDEALCGGFDLVYQPDYDYGLVFLSLSTPLKTDAKPTVTQVGDVEDLAGNSCTKEYSWLCDKTVMELEQPQTVIAQDGIGPIITLTVTPTEPGYNDLVTVTAQASEELSEAYLKVFEGSPDGHPEKPIGWPPEPPHELESAWTGMNWLVMEGVGNMWTVEFLNTFGPNDPWFVEVAAHDLTQWQEDMGAEGYWEDYECNAQVKWWKHEKWTEESIKFHAVEYIKIYLYEGWNLISVPFHLTNPSVGTVLHGSAVTKVYYWTGYGWQYSSRHPITGTLSGAITTIVPGKGYWVHCSPPEFTLRLYLTPPDPIQVPPAYNLVKGWNLIGFTALDYPLQYRSMADYLFSLCDICKLVYWYEAQPQEWNRVTPTADWWPSCKDRAKPGYGYWLYLATAGTLAP